MIYCVLVYKTTSTISWQVCVFVLSAFCCQLVMVGQAVGCGGMQRHVVQELQGMPTRLLRSHEQMRHARSGVTSAALRQSCSKVMSQQQLVLGDKSDQRSKGKVGQFYKHSHDIDAYLECSNSRTFTDFSLSILRQEKWQMISKLEQAQKNEEEEQLAAYQYLSQLAPKFGHGRYVSNQEGTENGVVAGACGVGAVPECLATGERSIHHLMVGNLVVQQCCVIPQ